ncbi:fructosamine kinase family protein [Dietzia sp. ANT_WB102]|uniref:fructosamine kinase family protein n=1 Tax=Dietzia sp. ANT_WB102 TaxID=2597345 RepID=UPI0011EC7D6E|nr:fructosamine kinase family protein [Dietzia sp. ANT_WB102]KAA0918694.1 phosphotransferase [Dietzia sp. ANT_WB102]
MSDQVFVKRGSGHGPDFYRHEAAGLAWLAAAPGGPRVVEVVGVDDDEITLERIPAGRATTRAALRFGRLLAAMHDAGAAAWGAPAHDWAGRCFIGNRPQDCAPTGSWGEFYAEQRVRPFVRIAVDLGVLGGTDLAVVERACDRVASGDLDDPDDVPARIHGDLWTGNVLWSGSGDRAHAVLIDPAAHGGHRETDLAMLALFGAPHLADILRGYDEAHPLRKGWQYRVPLHQLHPLATHSAGHGAGYAIALADAARQVLRL